MHTHEEDTIYMNAVNTKVSCLAKFWFFETNDKNELIIITQQYLLHSVNSILNFILEETDKNCQNSLFSLIDTNYIEFSRLNL